MMMRKEGLFRFASIFALLTLIACSQQQTSSAPEAETKIEAAQETGAPTFDIVAELDEGPGNLTLTPDGQLLVSLHQFFGHEIRVAQVKDNQTTAFAEAAEVNSVLGLQADSNGVVWLLDNAMRGGENRRLVGWHSTENHEVADIDLSAATASSSFLNDLAVDTDRETVYIADPAGGADAAIIVVNLAEGTARRLLQGHESVTPEDLDLVIDGTPVRIRAEDGSEIRPRIGINPIALDKAGEWLYYGPMHGLSMYRVRTADLLDTSLESADLAARVERFADKPICDGISIDDAGNLYLGDLANNAIGVINAAGEYRVLMQDTQLSWVDAFSFGPDGKLYAVVNQLHRSAALNFGERTIVPPYLVVKFDPLASGTTGR